MQLNEQARGNAADAQRRAVAAAVAERQMRLTDPDHRPGKPSDPVLGGVSAGCIALHATCHGKDVQTWGNSSYCGCDLHSQHMARGLSCLNAL